MKESIERISKQQTEIASDKPETETKTGKERDFKAELRESTKEAYIHAIKSYIDKEIAEGRSIEDIDANFLSGSVAFGPEKSAVEQIGAMYARIHGIEEPQRVIFDETIKEIKAGKSAEINTHPKKTRQKA